MDKNLSKLVKILISEQIALDTVFHFEQVFLFCRLINKNVLEWFLLIICKGHTLTISTNPFSKNHPTLCFWWRREGRQMPYIEQLIYQTDKSRHRGCSKKKLFLQISQYPQENTYVGDLQACNFIKKRLQHRCFPVAKFLGRPILKRIRVPLFLNLYEVILWNFVSR